MAVIIAAVFNSLIVWIFLLMTYYQGYEFFISYKLNICSSDMYMAGYLSIAITSLIVIIFSSRIGDYIINFILLNRKPIKSENDRLLPLLGNVHEQFCIKFKKKKRNVRLLINDKKRNNMSAIGTRTIVVDRYMYENFSDSVLEAVFAHELAHIYNNDSCKMGVIFTLLTVGSVLFFVSFFVMLISYFVSKIFNRGYFVFIGLTLLIATVLTGLITLCFFIIFAIFNIFLLFYYRKSEFKADRMACNLGYKNEIISFLNEVKDNDYNIKNLWKYIYSSHPKTITRIGKIEILN